MDMNRLDIFKKSHFGGAGVPCPWKPFMPKATDNRPIQADTVLPVLKLRISHLAAKSSNVC